jgi:ABC-type molybdenum transport system ATPase subunit/photorepair protein PhrA
MQHAVLSCESVSLTREGVMLFANLQFEAHPGELVVIQGSNGAVKSTLLCALGTQRWPSIPTIRDLCIIKDIKTACASN